MTENNSGVPVLDDAVFDMTNSENLHAEVSEILNKNVITEDDVERYQMNKDSSVSVGEFCNLLNSLLADDEDKFKPEEVAEELLKDEPEA